MVFQESALFDSLTVDENVGYRLYEETDMPLRPGAQRVAEVLGFIGLGEYIDRGPRSCPAGSVGEWRWRARSRRIRPSSC